jgi:glucose/arabinose dehydrogenase
MDRGQNHRPPNASRIANANLLRRLIDETASLPFNARDGYMKVPDQRGLSSFSAHAPRSAKAMLMISLRNAVLGLIAPAFALFSGGCFSALPSNGGGQIASASPRSINPRAIWLPPGYRIEAVMQGLNFPTGVTFDDQGRVYVTESGYSYGEVWTTPRLVRVVANDVLDVVARGSNGPWNGVTYYDGNFYVAEGGEYSGGRILKIAPDGQYTVLLDGLPSVGDHHTNGPVISKEGYLYFGQGTATNSGVVGLDNDHNGWLKRHPRFHDIPGKDIVLAGVNYQTSNPLARPRKPAWYQKLLPFLAPKPVALTGAYSAFGTPTHKGQVIKGQVPCTGAVMRIPVTGGEPELVAWGLRNPFGLAFDPNGKLFVTENQADVRGSRPVWGTGDLLWEIKAGAWYGWPDYFAGERIDNSNRFGAAGMQTPTPLLARLPGRPPKPVAKFGVHSSADGLDFSRDINFGHVGDAFVAEFGDMAPETGTVVEPVGFRVVRVETRGGIIHPFAVNRGRRDGPASKLGSGGLERPIAARFDPSGQALYIVDFGIMLTGPNGVVRPLENTGVLWRITREGTR